MVIARSTTVEYQAVSKGEIVYWNQTNLTTVNILIETTSHKRPICK